MIFVTLGTQDKQFRRLLDATLALRIDEKVVIQYGSTKPDEDMVENLEKNFELHQYLSNEEFEKYMKEARVIITHAGVGTIIEGLKLDKMMIVAARLKKYKEHVNDHQLQIMDTFEKEGYILRLDDFSKLPELLKENFKPKKFNSNKNNFNTYLEEEIYKLIKQ